MEYTQKIPALRRVLLILLALLLGLGLAFFTPFSGKKSLSAQTGAGQISGRVMQTNGAPISGATVKAFTSADAYYNGQMSANTVSSSDGSYTLTDLPDGNYIVLFNDYSDSGSNHTWAWQFYNASNKIPEFANPIAVNDSSAITGIDAYLLPAGQISGTVTDRDGNPLANIKVGAYGMNDDFTNNQELPITSTTDSNGNYTLQGVMANVYDYAVVFNMNHSDNYVQLWYDQVRTSDDATGVSVAAGQTRTGINAQLYQTGQISGTVASQFNKGIGGINVSLFAQGASYGDGPFASATTDGSGGFSLPDLPTGTYYLDVNDQNLQGYKGNYSSQWYDQVASESAATPLAVTSGSNRTINIHLNKLIPTLTILSSSPNPAHIGQKVTFTALPLPVLHGGLMIFKDNGQLMPGCAFTQFSGFAATCTTAYNQAGTHSVTATFAGDMTYKTSTSNTVVQKVLPRH